MRSSERDMIAVSTVRLQGVPWRTGVGAVGDSEGGREGWWWQRGKEPLSSLQSTFKFAER